MPFNTAATASDSVSLEVSHDHRKVSSTTLEAPYFKHFVLTDLARFVCFIKLNVFMHLFFFVFF